MWQSFETNGVARRERPTYWRDVVCKTLVGVDCDTRRNPDFCAAIDVSFGEQGSIATIRSNAHVAFRSPECVRQTGDDFFMLFLQRSGSMGITIDDQELIANPGDFYFYDGSKPHRLDFTQDFEHVAVRIPGPVMRDRWRHLAMRGCFVKSADDAMIRIAAAALIAASDGAGALSSGRSAMVIESVVDFFASSAVGHDLVDASSSSLAVTFARARAIINAELGNETFTPDHLASALGISRRALNKLFERNGTGVAELILQERLDHAARDLASIRSAHLSVGEIAYRWGFKNLSHFCRRYRERFGKPPTAARQPSRH
jgi:AraC family transcriptional regulator, positive regulator of tynA and feaB